jgi:hydrogenase expression/formation protein HypC
MCFAAPARVIETGAGYAIIERGGERLPILLHLLDEAIAVGDYIAVQAQRYAVAKLSTQEAAELLALYQQIDTELQEATGARA